MAEQLSRFKPINGIDGLFTATKGGLRCTAITLKTGGLCLHSPVAGLGARAKESLEELGAVELLLAPNDYHNKGMAEYTEAYPAALTVASEISRPRLERVTKLKFHNLEEFSDKLLDGMRLETPAGLKNGEVWLLARSVRGTGWLVVDAFAGGQELSEEGVDAVRLLSTFPKYGLEDRTLYLEWLDDLMLSDRPEVLIPCHGSIIRGANLSSRLRKLVTELP